VQVRASRLCHQAGLADGSVGAGGKIGRGNNLHLFTLRQPALDTQASIVPRGFARKHRPRLVLAWNDITSNKCQTASQKKKTHDACRRQMLQAE
jgi:hypothetical protein